ncbi:MAG: hypothetical protein M1835_003248 [Candelina submexicana]|nr:MAG: hypothetical protein M1835_003248 [Candelina submexicana]
MTSNGAFNGIMPRRGLTTNTVENPIHARRNHSKVDHLQLRASDTFLQGNDDLTAFQARFRLEANYQDMINEVRNCNESHENTAEERHELVANYRYLTEDQLREKVTQLKNEYRATADKRRALAQTTLEMREAISKDA